jgi:hypothetical protein
VCGVDGVGQVVCERKVPTEPGDIGVLLTSIGGDYVRIGNETGPLSQRLVNRLIEADLSVICVEIQHMKGSAQGPENQQERSQWRPRDRPDDMLGIVQTGACQDAGSSETTHAADRSPMRHDP